jgi:hypothetical protein
MNAMQEPKINETANVQGANKDFENVGNDSSHKSPSDGTPQNSMKSHGKRKNSKKKRKPKEERINEADEQSNPQMKTPIKHSTQSNTTNLGTPKYHSPSPVKMCNILCDSFDTFYKRTNAKKYKVHKPGCQCNKIQKIRSSNALNDNKLEGFIVIGENGKASCVYLHRVSIEEFAKDWKGTEKELKDVIFPKGINEEQMGFKVSCASCSLEVEPNGFACINSKSYSEVDYARELAENEKRNHVQSLHHDHAHRLLVLNQSIFHGINFKSVNKLGIPNSNVCDLNVALAKEGIDTDSIVEIELGHHLISLFCLMKKKDYFFLAIAFFDDIGEDKKKSIIDIPGGKRHLGETSMECAIRETREETSLVIDEKWNSCDEPPLQKKGGADRSNVYYDMRPPMEYLMNDTAMKLSKVTVT